jgi:hypothetical protein
MSAVELRAVKLMFQLPDLLIERAGGSEHRRRLTEQDASLRSCRRRTDHLYRQHGAGSESQLANVHRDFSRTERIARRCNAFAHDGRILESTPFLTGAFRCRHAARRNCARPPLRW